MKPTYSRYNCYFECEKQGKSEPTETPQLETGKCSNNDDGSSDIIHLPELIEIPGAPDDSKTHNVDHVKINLLNDSIEYIDNDKVKQSHKEIPKNLETVDFLNDCIKYLDDDDHTDDDPNYFNKPTDDTNLLNGKIENLNDDKQKNVEQLENLPQNPLDLPSKTLKKVPRPKNIEELKMQNKLFKIKLAKVDSIDDEDDFGEPEKKRRKIDDINAQDLNFDEVDVNDEEISNNVTNKISEKSTENLVLHHHSFLKEKLISVLNSHRFCALCLESNKPLKTFDEQIIIINDNWTQTILLKDVYSCVFKEEKSTSEYICTECTEKLQQSYIFIKYSQLTKQLLESYIDDLKFKTTDTLKDLTNESVKGTNTVLILESDDVNKYLHKEKGTNEYLHKEKEETTIETEIDNIETENDNEIEKQTEQNCDLNCKCLKCKKFPILLLKQPEIVAIETKPKQYKKVKETDMQEVQKFEVEHKKFPLVFFKQPLIEAIETKPTFKPVIKSKKQVTPFKKPVTPFKKPVIKINAKVLCEFCSVIVNNERRLDLHYVVEHSKLKCKFCLNFIDEEEIAQHLANEHKNDAFFCNECDYPFYSLKRKKLHAKIMQHDKSSEKNSDDYRNRRIKVKELPNINVGINCPECDELQCVHSKYLIQFQEQTLNHLHAKVKCADCDFVCISKAKLLEHVNSEHLKQIHICDQCGEQFPKSLTLKRHVIKYHSTLIFCKNCDKKFESSDKLSSHEELCRLTERDIKCENCTASFNTYERLEKHNNTRHKEVFPCLYCKKGFLTENMKNLHTSRIHGTLVNAKTFECYKCDEVFVNIFHLKKHLKTHRAYNCVLCEQEFRTHTQLRTHECPNNAGPFCACTICFKVVNQSMLERHLESHKNDEIVPCTVCKKYLNKSQLDRHMQYHKYTRRTDTPKKFNEQRKPRHKCEFCDYESYFPHRMENHINEKHLRVNPYVCHLCGNCYTGHRLLKTHLRNCHTSIRYPCTVCGNEYKRPQHLKVHVIQKHGGVKTFECNFCLEKFASSHLRYIHVLKKHSNKYHYCPLCPRKFSILPDLRRHIIVCHWKDRSNDAEKFDPREVEGLEKHYHLFPRWLAKQRNGLSGVTPTFQKMS